MSQPSESISHAAKPISHAAKPISHAAKPISHAAKPISHTAKPISHAAKPISHAAKPIYHTVKDYLFLAVIYYLDPPAPVYIFAAGCMMWALFVVGHDCGHGSFSGSTLINDVIGHLTHGCLLVPYYPWQLSHSRHHRYHMHKDKDNSHKWSTPDDDNYTMHNIFMLPFYLPAYLYLGAFDGSHIRPGSKMFTDNQQRWQCIISSLWCLVNIVVITWFLDFNPYKIGYYYMLPWLVFNSLLYIITFLQHHDLETTVYDGDNWTFKLGAEETIDLSYGWFFDWLFHHITDCHKFHHYHTKVPHYELSAESAKAGYVPKQHLGHFGWLLYFHKIHNHTQFLTRQDNVYKFATADTDSN